MGRATRMKPEKLPGEAQADSDCCRVEPNSNGKDFEHSEGANLPRNDFPI
jgi:hypothetical protein